MELEPACRSLGQTRTRPSRLDDSGYVGFQLAPNIWVFVWDVLPFITFWVDLMGRAIRNGLSAEHSCSTSQRTGIQTQVARWPRRSAEHVVQTGAPLSFSVAAANTLARMIRSCCPFVSKSPSWCCFSSVMSTQTPGTQRRCYPVETDPEPRYRVVSFHPSTWVLREHRNRDSTVGILLVSMLSHFASRGFAVVATQPKTALHGDARP